jgi:uroporphyrinogen-III synthase
MRRVLVTRPEPGASQTAHRLAAGGFAPLLLPLFETHALFVDGGSIPDAAGAVAVSSANAIRHAPRELVERLAARPCFAVGEKTAETARAAGFLRVTEGRGDAEALARTIMAADRDGPVVYLCGRVRRPAFEEMLTAAGIAVKAIEIYDTVRIEYEAGPAVQALGGLPVDAALLYSAAAAEALTELLDRPEFANLFENTAFLCLSARVAETLERTRRGKILTAKEPTEDALLSLLGKSG